MLAALCAVALGASVLVAWNVIAREAEAAPTCLDFYFVAARGSGQPYNGNNPKTEEKLQGSPETKTVLDGVLSAYASKKRSPRYEVTNVDYPARSVVPMISSLGAAIAYPRAGTILAARYTVGQYLEGEREAETAISKAVERIVGACPTANVVLAGFSQGAMAVHNYLGATSRGTNIAAAVLIGDPERLPNSPVKNTGAAPKESYGVCRVLEGFPDLSRPSCLPDYAKVKEVPESLRQVTTHVCAESDSVCSTSQSTKIGDPLGNAQRLLQGTFGVHLNCNVYCTSPTRLPGVQAGHRILDQGGSSPRDPESNESGTAPGLIPTSGAIGIRGSAREPSACPRTPQGQVMVEVRQPNGSSVDSAFPTAFAGYTDAAGHWGAPEAGATGATGYAAWRIPVEQRNGSPLPTGKYTVTFSCTDVDGKTLKQYPPFTFSANDAAPTVAVSPGTVAVGGNIILTPSRSCPVAGRVAPSSLELYSNIDEKPDNPTTVSIERLSGTVSADGSWTGRLKIPNYYGEGSWQIGAQCSAGAVNSGGVGQVYRRAALTIK